MIGVLFLAAVAIAIAVAQRSNLSFFKQQTQQSSTVTATLSEREAVLKFPGENASLEEIEAHAALLKKLTVRTDTLEIGDSCSTTPLVMEVKLDSTFIVRNRDDAEHALKVGSTRMIIPRNGSKSYGANIDNKGVGNFAYSCDDDPDLIGVIRIVPE